MTKIALTGKNINDIFKLPSLRIIIKKDDKKTHLRLQHCGWRHANRSNRRHHHPATRTTTLHPRNNKKTMTPKQFFILVAQMRMAQKKYLSTYDRRQLDLVKRMEKYLDMEIKFAKKETGIEIPEFTGICEILKIK